MSRADALQRDAAPSHRREHQALGKPDEHASSYLWLADYKQAEAHARTALAVQESATPADRTPKAEAIARIDLGTALVNLGSLDEATAHGSQALSSTRVADSVLSRAGELDRALMTCFPREAIARSFHEQYRQITKQANRQC